MTSENITVSRETLRAELAGLELRLVDRLRAELDTKADAALVTALSQRIESLELSRAGRAHLSEDVTTINTRLARLERFRYAVPSVSVIALFITILGLLLSGHTPA